MRKPKPKSVQLETQPVVLLYIHKYMFVVHVSRKLQGVSTETDGRSSDASTVSKQKAYSYTKHITNAAKLAELSSAVH